MHYTIQDTKTVTNLHILSDKKEALLQVGDYCFTNLHLYKDGITEASVQSENVPFLFQVIALFFNISLETLSDIEDEFASRLYEYEV